MQEKKQFYRSPDDERLDEKSGILEKGDDFGEKKSIISKVKDAVSKMIGSIREKLADMKSRRAEKVTENDTPREESAPQDELPEMPELYLPETTEDLIWLLKRMPEEVLTPHEKQILGYSMSFFSRRVRDIMTPKEDVTFVHENDFMGPLTLDRLYKAGYEHFPVLDTKGGIAGILHTESLNSLEIRETDRASSYLDKNVYYMRDNYTLEEALAAFLRTNSYFFIVVNQGAQMVGLITFQTVVGALIGQVPKDDFCQDTDLMAVAKRGLGVNAYVRTDATRNRF